jgi:repressor LexA
MFFTMEVSQVVDKRLTIEELTMRERNKLSDRQRGILRFMETYLHSYGFPPTIREIGEATGIASTSVVNYNLNKLVDAGYLSRESSKSRGIRLVKSINPQNNQTPRTIRVALRGQIVASRPVPVHDELHEEVEVMMSLLCGVDPSEVFALRVKGDSMIDAMIDEGDIVIFRKQDTAQNGDMVAVWLDERGETTLKRFYHEGERVRLQPAHPTMQPIYVSPDHCHVQGRVLSVVRYMS